MKALQNHSMIKYSLMLFRRYVLLPMMLSGVFSSCTVNTPDAEAIAGAPVLSDRAAPDPVLEKYIALLNREGDHPAPAQRYEYLDIIGRRFAHIAAERDMEDYGRYNNGFIYTYQTVTEGEDSIVIKPAYLVAKQPELIPVKKRLNFTPFRVNRKEAISIFLRK